MSRHWLVRCVAGAAAALSLITLVSAQGNERSLYVSVWDEKTRAPITGLDTGAFVVHEDGVRREVLRVTSATSPMSVAILVDNSQAATSNIPDLRKALTTFVRAIDGLGPVSIVGVADRPTILRDYATDQKLLADGIGRIFALPGSGATLLDAVVEVSKGLEKRETDRAAMVIVTGENEEFSNRHYKDVLEALAKGGAMMYALVLTGRKTPDRQPRRNRAPDPPRSARNGYKNRRSPFDSGRRRNARPPCRRGNLYRAASGNRQLLECSCDHICRRNLGRGRDSPRLWFPQ